MELVRRLERALEALYTLAGWVAAAFLIALAALVLASIVSRLLGVYLPGVIEYSGYSMASSSFFALAYAFRNGSHIRVNLLLSHLHGRAHQVAEIWCHGAAAAAGGFLAYYACKLAWVSYQFGERSEGADAILLWIPQTGMAAGAVIFALCLAHSLVRVICEPGYQSAARPEAL